MKKTLNVIAIGVVVIALQNAGIIPPLKTAKTRIDGTVPVTGSVDVRGSVDVDNTVDVQGTVGVDNPVKVDLSSVVGRDLVESQHGMYIGVASVSNTLIPIHWGEMSVDVDNTVNVQGAVDVDNTVDVEGIVSILRNP